MDMISIRRALLARVGAEPVDPTPTGYVTNGLLLWLDAKCNTRNGHSASSAVWEDLSGNNRDYILGDNAIINRSEIVFSSENRSRTYTERPFTNEEGLSIRGNEATIEFVGMVFDKFQLAKAEDGYHCFSTLNVQSYGCFCALNDKNGTGNVIISFDPADGNKSVLTDQSRHYINSHLWVDGVQRASAGFTTSWRFRNLSLLFCYHYSTDEYWFYGSCNAIRIYNRKLTDEELTQNWLRDKARYNL